MGPGRNEVQRRAVFRKITRMSDIATLRALLFAWFPLLLTFSSLYPCKAQFPDIPTVVKGVWLLSAKSYQVPVAAMSTQTLINLEAVVFPVELRDIQLIAMRRRHGRGSAAKNG